MRGILQVVSSKAVLLALMIGAVLGATANIALASPVYSPYYYYGPVYGWYYQNQAAVWDYQVLQGSTFVGNQNAGDVPAGYMGALANLYIGSGALCETSGWQYDDTSGTVSFQVFTLNTTCGSGTYYSRGESAAYNGNGYNYYSTYTSPDYSY